MLVSGLTPLSVNVTVPGIELFTVCEPPNPRLFELVNTLFPKK